MSETDLDNQWSPLYVADRLREFLQPWVGVVQEGTEAGGLRHVPPSPHVVQDQTVVNQAGLVRGNTLPWGQVEWGGRAHQAFQLSQLFFTVLFNKINPLVTVLHCEAV